MSWRTKCNYCTLQSYKRRYGEDNLIIKKVPSHVPRIGDGRPWTELYLKEGDKERFLCSFAAVTNQCVC